MGKIAFVFPGQGSQTVGMGKDLYEHFPEAREVFDAVDSALKGNLSSIIFSGPPEALKQTANAQPALLATSIALLTCMKDLGIRPDFVAGHSLGEYTACVAAGVLSLTDAARLVRKRGEYMEEAVPNGKGTMAALMGMDRDILEGITDAVSKEGYPVQMANLNCPGQIVISGTNMGIHRTIELAKEKGLKRAIPLEVSGPFHSSLMKKAADRFEKLLHNYSFHDAEIPIVSNVTGRIMKESSKIKQLLIQQLYSPVLWEDTVRFLITEGVDTFIEIGPGRVLSGLIRKIDRNVQTFAISDQESLRKTISQIKGVEK